MLLLEHCLIILHFIKLVKVNYTKRFLLYYYPLVNNLIIHLNKFIIFENIIKKIMQNLLIATLAVLLEKKPKLKI